MKSISKKIVLAVCFSMMTSFAASNAVVSSFASVAAAAPNKAAAEAELNALKAKGYSESDIRAAMTIAFASKNSVKNVAAKKTSSNTWKDVQKAFHVSDAQYNAAAKEIEAHKK